MRVIVLWLYEGIEESNTLRANRYFLGLGS